jgi:hypothetical protein
VRACWGEGDSAGPGRRRGVAGSGCGGGPPQPAVAGGPRRGRETDSKMQDAADADGTADEADANSIGGGRGGGDVAAPGKSD